MRQHLRASPSIGAALLLLTWGCQTTSSSHPPDGPPPAVTVRAAPSPESGGSRDRPPSPGDNDDPRIQKFIEEVVWEQNARRAAADQAVLVARRHLDALEFDAAAQKLTEALRLEPGREDAQRLLDRVGFMRGERTHEIPEFARELAEFEKVRRQVQHTDLQREYLRGLKLYREGKYEEAAKTFQRILDAMKWFDRDEEPPRSY